ncbi:phosphoribosylglycinamide formyltransferase [Alteripontixanthobacter maritimus]|uniref:phosphoribosylglycinamide formyltransferase n=1 Tax=Alteripontixanthobacter maritimus TaxID=2161824 RepID=UPI00227D93E3|nr:phosphoribosylglycinamide formyltransferase [Alteripontixanthobacter maritimus]
MLISGSGTNMAALLYASRMPSCRHEIVLVASNDMDAGGLKLAAAEGVATFAQSHRGMDRMAHEGAMERAIRKSGADYVVLAGYMRILSEELVGRWAGRMLNIHPSLLPKYRGLDTHKRALDAGDSVAGCTVHLVNEKLDGGEPLGQIEVAILPGDTPDTLAARVRIAEHQLYPRVLERYVSRGFDAGWLYEKVQRIALSLPESKERPTHGSPGWRTGGKTGKYFAIFSDRHHDDKRIAVFAKTSGPDELAMLIEQDPDVFYKPAYYGASGWVGLVLNRADTDWDQVEHLIRRSWQSVAPRRLTKLQSAADEF